MNMQKNQEIMFSTFLVNLLKTRSRYGATAMRAILWTCKNNWLDLDTVFEYDNGNSHLVNGQLSWVFLGERNKGEFEKRLYENLVRKEEKFICCLIQVGLMQCKCRNGLKMFTHKMAKAMPIDSSTCLMEFSKTHPEILDLLQCQFAHTISATQIIEAANDSRETYTTTSRYDNAFLVVLTPQLQMFITCRCH